MDHRCFEEMLKDTLYATKIEHNGVDGDLELCVVDKVSMIASTYLEGLEA